MKSLLFSSKVVQSLNAKARTYTVWDTKNPALGVRVYADGRRFYVTYLPIPNKTLAAVGQFTLKQARDHVQALQGSFLEKETKPIRLIRFDALVKEEWAEKVLKEWKPSTQVGALSALRKYLLPEFGRYPVGSIDSCRVHRWFDELSQSYAGAANRNLDVLRSIFKYAVKQGYCMNNPCDGIQQNRKKKLNRFLSLDELARFHKALMVVSQQGDMEACCCQVLNLILLTGCRISEVTGLKWSFIKGNEWYLPDSKTGAKVVYVGKEAQQLLLDISNQAWSKHSEPHDDVFAPLRRFVSRATKVGMIWQQVRALANIEDVRIHDLRHTFASYAVLEGYPIPMVSKLLGHARISSTLRYTHVDDAQVSESAERVGDVITEIITVERESHSKVKKRKSRDLKAKPKPKASNIVTDEQIRDIRNELDFLSW
ncbi:site-specific integrase [Vibrio splendidus]|uniref:tyrosine-type recombinase/integrase n=1 Tax=Vibrio splendidus TaxID=29497 RepID=UPI002734393A|nr:site-specific integrase [Vibrio splendidus]MDP2592759.1 site-specific integrase [Vibrio splendidus]